MTQIDNSAGRLYELLLGYMEGSNDRSMRQAWSIALGVPEDQVAFSLGKVGELLREVRSAAENDPSGVYEPLPIFIDQFIHCIFPLSQPIASPASNTQPDGNGMNLLRAFALHLHYVAPEGTVPDAAQLDELRPDIADLQASVRDSTLPDEVKRAVLKRLAQMLEAFDELSIGGPEAIRSAAEALAGSIVVNPEAAKEKSLVAKLATFVTKTVAIVAVARSGSDTCSRLARTFNFF